MRYRLTHDDASAIEVEGATWERFLERAYRNGWRPCGTEPPWSRPQPHKQVRSTSNAKAWGGRPASCSARWASADYFSPSQQYVRADDALELASAAMRGDRAPVAEDLRAQSRRHAADLAMARFARAGGFVIGQVS
jgi:hypothetical protein